MQKGLFILVFIVISCSKKEKTTTGDDGKWNTYTTTDSIPEVLREKVMAYYHGDLDMANPGAPYNATDMRKDSLPTRQLMLLAKKGDEWRMSYVQGGYGKYYVYVQATIQKKAIRDFKVAESRTPLDNNDTIDKQIKNHQLEFKNSTK